MRSLTTGKRFPEALQTLMKDRLRTYRELASATGLSAGYLHHVSHGNRPTPSDDVLASVARAFGLPADYFLETRVRAVARFLADRPALVKSLYHEVTGERCGD